MICHFKERTNAYIITQLPNDSQRKREYLNTLTRKIPATMSSEIIIYQNNSGDIKPDVRLEEETGWLTQD
jgi:hypothetical protein